MGKYEGIRSNVEFTRIDMKYILKKLDYFNPKKLKKKKNTSNL